MFHPIKIFEDESVPIGEIQIRDDRGNIIIVQDGGARIAVLSENGLPPPHTVHVHRFGDVGSDEIGDETRERKWIDE